jgi:hypothetical protein
MGEEAEEDEEGVAVVPGKGALKEKVEVDGTWRLSSRAIDIVVAI